MDYFVNIENTPYFHWQVDLLIESFKKHNLQDNLVIGMEIGKQEKSLPEFQQNLTNHSRKYAYENSAVGMYGLLEQRLLQQPFMCLPPDCVLYKPPVIAKLTKPHVVFQVSDLKKVGRIIYFDNMHISFFGRAVFLSDQKHIIWENIIQEIIGKAVVDGVYTLEMPLDYIHEYNFISYEKGIQPHFCKTMFPYSSNSLFSFGDPFEVLSKLYEVIDTAPVKFIGELARNRLDIRDDKK